MDGTLLDSMHIWAGAASNYIRSRGITPPPDLDQTVQVMTMPECVDYLKKLFHLEEDEQQLINMFYDGVRSSYMSGVPCKPGVCEFLERLSKSGVRMAVATATDRPMSEPAIEKSGLSGYFQCLVTCREAGFGKEHPDVFEQARKILGTPVEQTLVVEDSIQAMRTAQKAGFPVLAVYDKYSADYWNDIEKLADEAVYNMMESEAFDI